MRINFHLSPVAACLALTLASSANAAEQLSLDQVSLQHLQQQFYLSLPNIKPVNSTSADVLQFVKQHKDKNQVRHVRMQQYYAGFMVFGGYAIMHSDGSINNLLNTQKDVQMNGTVYRGLQVELGDPPEDFVKNSSKILQQFKAKFQNKDVSEEQITPIIYIDDKHQAHWAYKVSIFVRYDHQIPERPTAILDAKSSKPFVEWNDIKTAVRTPVKGIGFGGNTKIGEYVFGKNYPFLEMTRDNKKERCYMENENVKVVDMEHDYFSTNDPMKFNCKTTGNTAANTFWTGYKADGYDRENGAFSPTNDALYAGYIIKHMYHDWYGVEVLVRRNGAPMQIVMRVHYGEGYENAYWDGRQMTFGDGDTTMYPLVSLGIGGHEISHGFTEQHSALEYFGQSGGMNESFSDMAAQAAEYYSSGKNNWLIGAEIVKENSGRDVLRYMDKPSRDGHSIDSADEYYGGLDVHHSSGVFNRLFYLMANQSGWNTRKAFDVMIKANMDYWTPYSTFDEGGCGVLRAAKDLGYSLSEIKKVLGAVAINYQLCENPKPNQIPST